MNPYLALAALIAVLGVGSGSYWWGWSAKGNSVAAETLVSVSRAIEQANELAREDAEILATADVRREVRRVAMKQLDQEIEKNVAANPAYLECGLDAIGLRNWNLGNAGNAPDLPGERGYGLPTAPLGQIGQALRPGEESQRGDRPLPPVQRSIPDSAGAGE